MPQFITSNPAVSALNRSREAGLRDLRMDIAEQTLARQRWADDITMQDRAEARALDAAVRKHLAPPTSGSGAPPARAPAGGTAAPPADLMSVLATLPGSSGTMLEMQEARTERFDEAMEAALEHTARGEHARADAVLANAGLLDANGEWPEAARGVRGNPTGAAGIKFAEEMGYKGQAASDFVTAWMQSGGDITAAGKAAAAAPPSAGDLTEAQESANRKIDIDRGLLYRIAAEKGRDYIRIKVTGVDPITGFLQFDEPKVPELAFVIRSAMKGKTGPDPEYEDFVRFITGEALPAAPVGGETAPAVPTGGEAGPTAPAAETAPQEDSGPGMFERVGDFLSEPLFPGDSWSSIFGGDTGTPSSPVPGAQGLPASAPSAGATPKPVADLSLQELQYLDEMVPPEVLLQRYSPEELDLMERRRVQSAGGVIPTPAGAVPGVQGLPAPVTAPEPAQVQPMPGAMPGPPADPNAELMRILNNLQEHHAPVTAPEPAPMIDGKPIESMSIHDILMVTESPERTRELTAEQLLALVDRYHSLTGAGEQ